MMDKIVDITKITYDYNEKYSVLSSHLFSHNYSSSLEFFRNWVFRRLPSYGKQCFIRRKYFAIVHHFFIADLENILVVRSDDKILISSNNFKKNRQYVYIYRKLRRLLIDNDVPFEFRDDLNDYFLTIEPIKGSTIKDMKYNEKKELKEALEAIL
jgi:hypothetical protein